MNRTDRTADVTFDFAMATALGLGLMGEDEPYELRLDGIYPVMPPDNPALYPGEYSALLPFAPNGYTAPALPLPCQIWQLVEFLEQAGLMERVQRLDGTLCKALLRMTGPSAPKKARKVESTRFLRNLWVRLDRPGGADFFLRLKGATANPKSPIKEWVGHGKGARIVYVDSDGREKTLKKPRILNLVSEFRKAELPGVADGSDA